MPKTKKLPKIKMLLELRDPKYHNLCIISAQNLGMWGPPDFEKAYAWLYQTAVETSEEGVVAEVNFCR